MTNPPKIHLKVSEQEALKELRTIDHKYLQGALDRGEHWEVRGNEVCWSSACWLYCWAKTGHRSERVAHQAREVLNAILYKDYDWFEKNIGWLTAREDRYKPCP